MSASRGRPASEEIREYLLRRMPESARATFEEAYFQDDGLLDRIEDEEDRLVADYVQGRLTESDRRRFTDALLETPYYQERVRTTGKLNLKLLDGTLRKTRAERTHGPGADDRLFPGRSGYTIVIALLSILLVAAVVSALRLKSEVDRLRATAPAAQPAR